MRRAVMCGLFAVCVFSAVTCAAPEQKKKKTDAGEKLNSQAEKLSYAVGMQVAGSLKDVGMEVDLEAFVSGVKDSMTDRETRLTKKEAQTIRQEYVKQRRAEREKRRKEQARKRKKKAQQFLEKNKKKEGVKTTDSGLQYKVLKEGKGTKPTVADRVDARVTMKTLDGQELFNSAKADTGELAVKTLLPGLQEGMKLMKEGAEYRFFVPPELGIKRKGDGVGRALIIDVKLNEVLENAATEKKDTSGGQQEKQQKE